MTNEWKKVIIIDDPCAIDMDGSNSTRDDDECMNGQRSEGSAVESAVYLKTSKQLSNFKFMLLENATCATDNLFTVAIRAAIMVSYMNTDVCIMIRYSCLITS